MVEAIEEMMNRLRADLKQMEFELRCSLDHPQYDRSEEFPGQHAEMKAQTMLAIRHIEDARMRCGKVLQYADDGVSILDK